MSEEQTHDYGDAITSLSRIVLVLENRLGSIEKTLDESTRERSKYLQELVATFLPSISGSVLKVLHKEFPKFVTYEVEDAFRNHGRLFGIFAGSVYKTALNLLQARFSSYVSGLKFGRLQEIDAEISRQTARKADIEEKVRQTHKLVALVKRAELRSVPMNSAIRGHVRRLVDGVRPSPQTPSRNRTQSSNYDDDLPPYVSSSDPNDFYYLLQNLTGNQTVEEPYVGGGGSSGGAGATGDWTTDEPAARSVGIADVPVSAPASEPVPNSDCDRGSDDADNGNVVNEVSNACNVPDSGGSSVSGIATDDSLGRFS
jgi:hypothetical protein